MYLATQISEDIRYQAHIWLPKQEIPLVLRAFTSNKQAKKADVFTAFSFYFCSFILHLISSLGEGGGEALM